MASHGTTICLLALAVTPCLMAQAPANATDRFLYEIAGNPDALRKALDAGVDPNQRDSEGIRLLSSYGRFTKGHACLRVLLKSPKLVINDPGDLGCSALRDMLSRRDGIYFPETAASLQLLLDAGAKPYWHDGHGKRVELIPFLLPSANPWTLKVALNHPTCRYQLAGEQGQAILQKAVELRPQDPGWCGTGYDSYVSQVSESSEAVVRKCLELGARPEISLLVSAVSASNPDVLGLLLRATPKLSSSLKKELFENTVKGGSGFRLRYLAADPAFQPLPIDWPYGAWLERYLQACVEAKPVPSYLDVSLTTELIGLGKIPEDQRLELYWKFQDKYWPSGLCGALKLDPECVLKAAPENEQAFYQAINSDDPSAVQKMLGSGASLAWRDGNGRGPIEFAAWCGAPRSLSVLLESGQGKNAEPRVLDNAFYFAAASGHEACLRQLMVLLPREIPGRSPSVLRASQWRGESNDPVAEAAENGHLGILRIIRDGKFGPDLPADTWDNALIAAARGGQDEAFRALIDEFKAVPGKPVESISKLWPVYYREDSLAYAARRGDLELMDFVLGWAAQHPGYILSNRAAIGQAVQNGRGDALDLLLKKANPEPNAISWGIYWAVLRDRRDFLARLLRVHVDWKSSEFMPVDAMAIAAVNNRMDIVDQLMRGGVDPNHCDKRVSPVLIKIWGITESIGSPSQSGSSASPYFVVKTPSVEAIRHLIKVEKADPNVRDLAGHSALELACLYGTEEAALELLASGADPTLHSKYGPGSILELAGNRDMAKLVEMLKQREGAR